MFFVIFDQPARAVSVPVMAAAAIDCPDTDLPLVTVIPMAKTFGNICGQNAGQ